MRERHFADYVDVVIKAFINHSVRFFFSINKAVSLKTYNHLSLLHIT